MSNVIILSIVVMTTALGADVKPVPFTRQEGTIKGTTKNGDTLLGSREMVVDVAEPGRSPGSKGQLFILFDKPTGLFFWQYGPLSPSGDLKPRIATMRGGPESKIDVRDDQIVLFLFRDSPPRLFVEASTRHADSLADAETKALREIADQPAQPGGKEVSLPLPQDFFYRMDPTHPGVTATSYADPSKLTGVAQKDGNWEVLLENHWKAKLILNDKYDLVSWERIP